MENKWEDCLEEIGAQKEYSEKGSWSEYLQFVLIIRQPFFLIRILKAKIGRNEFSCDKLVQRR